MVPVLEDSFWHYDACQVTIFLRRLHTPDFTRLTDSDSLTQPKRSLLIAWIGSLQGPSINDIHNEGWVRAQKWT